MRFNYATRVILSYLTAVLLVAWAVDYFMARQVPAGADFAALRRTWWLGVLAWLVVSLALTRIYFRRLQRVIKRWRRLDKKFQKQEVPLPKSADDLENMGQWMNEISQGLERKIEELTRERNQLQTILDTLQEGVIFIDESGNIALLNPAARVLLGIGKKALGRPPIESIRNPDLQAIVDETLGGTDVKNREIRIFRKGQEVFLLVQTSTLGGGQRHPGAIMAFVDITHLRRLERMRRDFVDNVSHELKTPLTSIQGYVETLIDGAFQDPDQAKNFLGVIDANARRLSKLVEDLLRLSEIETQKFDPVHEEIPVKSLFEEVVHLHEVQLKKKEVTVHYSTSLETLSSDRSAISNILGNLVDNAIKYGEPKSELRLECQQKNQAAVFSVSNQGMGIEAVHLDRIFERFYRVDKSRSRQEGGTGLGLAIVKHLVQLLQGEVWAESEFGKGTTFYFSIPLPQP